MTLRGLKMPRRYRRNGLAGECRHERPTRSHIFAWAETACNQSAWSASSTCVRWTRRVRIWYGTPTRSAPSRPHALLASLAARRKICAGKAHIAAQVFPKYAPVSMSRLARTPRRFAAVQDFHKSGSARKKGCGVAQRGREIALRRIRSAKAVYWRG